MSWNPEKGYRVQSPSLLSRKIVSLAILLLHNVLSAVFITAWESVKKKKVLGVWMLSKAHKVASLRANNAH